MQHELLSAGAHVLAMLQHSSLHTCPHTWPQRWHSFFECRPDLKLPLVFRVQVGSEATGPILLADNAISMRKIRPGADCFAALDVLPVARLQSGGRCWGVRARARAEGRLSRPVRVMDWSCARG